MWLNEGYEWARALYGTEGLALLALLGTLWGMQLYDYLGPFRRVAVWKNGRRTRRLTDLPPVSLIVVTTDDEGFLTERLPLLLAQDHPDYEVVVVYVGNDEEYSEALSRTGEGYGRLTLTRIRHDARFPISDKLALNVGIKAARHEHLLFTTSRAVPASDRWVRLMAKGFERGEVVLGYAGWLTGRGFTGRMIRTQRMMSSARWLSAAVRGRPYRGARATMGFTRTAYFGVRGFNHLNMKLGIDDLFLQTLMRAENTSVVLTPRAAVREPAPSGWKAWMHDRRIAGYTRRYYPQRFPPLGWEAGSRLLFYLTAAAALIWMPVEVKIVALVLLAARWAVVLAVVRRIARRLGERCILGSYLLYDLADPVAEGFLALMRCRKERSIWR